MNLPITIYIFGPESADKAPSDLIDYKIMFWLCFSISILFPLLAIPAAKYMQEGTLGIVFDYIFVIVSLYIGPNKAGSCRFPPQAVVSNEAHSNYLIVAVFAGDERPI